MIFSNERIVNFNSNRILNTACLHPIHADGDGDIAKWPFIHEWLHQLFANTDRAPTNSALLLCMAEEVLRSGYHHHLNPGSGITISGANQQGEVIAVKQSHRRTSRWVTLMRVNTSAGSASSTETLPVLQHGWWMIQLRLRPFRISSKQPSLSSEL